ncbi:MAG: ParB/RepB/Spo0J family partition protein [Candidatus Viridilinea halotolerans]|uniref:ParB/RepB/Spo0J family partition protein n=1 Tax=Candidatus Viridilinea halotolerans TaxID=2491704 RepID=A0A426U954_9CHLR|nr:MAG: ParB/RepB/Spo0J family partition protein [Candidatus Viridilinea halotolerans]
MSKRRSDDQQAQEIKARLALRARPVAPPAAPVEPSAPSTSQEAERNAHARQHFLGPQLDSLVAGRALEQLAVTQIAPELRQGMRQPRMLPLPNQLLVAGETPPEYQELVAELRELGASLRERQIQPIVVYPGSSEAFPAARYIILIGQRRWTAAQLVGLAQLEAIVIETPSPLDRITLQFAENEARESFSDIERAWTLQQLRETMGGEQVAVGTVASKLSIKRSRAYQLLRMLAFPPEQQQLIALLRLQERQLLPLIDAIHQSHVGSEQSAKILQRLREIAAERALNSRQLAEEETTRSVESPRRSGIDAATVARLVARASSSVALGGAAQNTNPRWYQTLLEDCTSLSRKLHRASERTSELGSQEHNALREQTEEIQRQIQLLHAALEVYN